MEWERKREEGEGVQPFESTPAESPTQKRKTSIKGTNKVSEKPADSPKVRVGEREIADSPKVRGGGEGDSR